MKAFMALSRKTFGAAMLCFFAAFAGCATWTFAPIRSARFVSEDGEVVKSEAPKGTVVNSVGAGDSMVAGFVAGTIETGDYEKAFRMGLCTGSASAFSPDLATRPEVEALLAQLAK